MKKLILISGLVAALAGCQTRVTCERYPDTYLPIEELVEVDGTQRVMTVGWKIACGGWCATARSPLFAKEQFRGFRASVETNGIFSVSLDTYERDLSTNAVVMTKTIFDGSANLAVAVAKAYATIQSGGATDASAAIVNKVVSFFKSRGGVESTSTVTSDGKKIIVTDGSTCIECDAQGNCSDCADRP